MGPRTKMDPVEPGARLNRIGSIARITVTPRPKTGFTRDSSCNHPTSARLRRTTRPCNISQPAFNELGFGSSSSAWMHWTNISSWQSRTEYGFPPFRHPCPSAPKRTSCTMPELWYVFGGQIDRWYLPGWSHRAVFFVISSVHPSISLQRA